MSSICLQSRCAHHCAVLCSFVFLFVRLMVGLLVHRHPRHTDRFQVVPFMGVFVKEEMVSGSVFGNPAGQFVCFCWIGMDQFNCLLLHVQPLKRVKGNTVQSNIHLHSHMPRALNIPHQSATHWDYWAKLLVDFHSGLPAECS